MRYALWLREDDRELFEMAPEAGAFLEAQLHGVDPGTPEVHAEIGAWLSALALHAPEWIWGNLGRILPAAPAHWQATWRAHLQSGAPPRRAVGVLKDAYARAAEELCPPEPDLIPGVEAPGTKAQEWFAEHPVILYGRGDLEALGLSGLLDAFFRRAATSLRRHALWFVGYSLRREGEQAAAQVAIPAEVLERSRQLWNKRFALAQRDPPIREELPAFGTWFACGRFDDTWALDQLDQILDAPRNAGDESIANQHDVMRRLASVAVSEPGVKCRDSRRIVKSACSPLQTAARNIMGRTRLSRLRYCMVSPSCAQSGSQAGNGNGRARQSPVRTRQQGRPGRSRRASRRVTFPPGLRAAGRSGILFSLPSLARCC